MSPTSLNNQIRKKKTLQSDFTNSLEVFTSFNSEFELNQICFLKLIVYKPGLKVLL